MFMRIRSRLLLCFLLFWGMVLIQASEPAGYEKKCGDLKEERKTKTVPIDEFRQAALGIVDDLANKAKEMADSAEIDASFVREYLEGLELGWAEERLARATADFVENAAAQLEEKVGAFAETAVDLARAKVEEVIKDLGPNVKFQADLKWKENCCEKAEWSRGGANPVGKVGFKASLKFGFEIEAGVAAIVGITVPVKLKVSAKGDWKVVRCNPVAPTSGTGSSLTITATPLWESTVEGEIEAEAGITVAIGGGITNADTLKDVKGTLNCP